ncbi:MAG: hypothetical protein V3W34_12690 [Phycisphaerae bacterium]
MSHSPVALRGWMILGKATFRDERATAWSAEIEPSMANGVEVRGARGLCRGEH